MGAPRNQNLERYTNRSCSEGQLHRTPSLQFRQTQETAQQTPRQESALRAKIEHQHRRKSLQQSKVSLPNSCRCGT